jgi:hypothetical protein
MAVLELVAGAFAEGDEVVDCATVLRALVLACGVFEVKRVASATLRGLLSTAIGILDLAFAGVLGLKGGDPDAVGWVVRASIRR